MTDTPRPTPMPTPNRAGDHTLRPDPLGAADPAAAPGAAGDFTLRPDPVGVHDPLAGADVRARDEPARDASQTAADRASDLANETRDRVKGIADDLHERVTGAADQAKTRATAAYEDARDRVGAMHRRHMERIDDITARGLDGVNRGRSTVERFVDDNPLLVGVVGVAAGLLLGALLPRTRPEDRNLGPWADEMRDQGLRYAREMTSRGREFVETALDPDNINAAARKASDTPPPPPEDRARHTL